MAQGFDRLAAENRARTIRGVMNARFEDGERRQQQLLETVASMVIRDRLVPPKATRFNVAPVEGSHLHDLAKITIGYAGDETTYDLHRHALNQLCAKVGLPMTYVNSLWMKSTDQWRLHLLAHNLNELFHQTSFQERGKHEVMFLHRLVGKELRGFLSRRFNRHLASLPLLRAFVDACRDVGAEAVDSVATDLKFGLTSYLPFVFQPISSEPEELVAVGVSWGNSDFGAGTMRVNQLIWRPKSHTAAVIDEAISKVHIGSVIQESDIELSAETAAKEVDTQASAIRDAVRIQLSQDAVEKLLVAIERAHAEQIDWTTLRHNLSRILQKNELETLDKVIETGRTTGFDLPPVGTVGGKPIPSKWWASQAVSTFAVNETDEDRKSDLQKAAGQLIGRYIME